MSAKNEQLKFDDIIKIYLDKIQRGDGNEVELEARFGTRGVKRTSKINFDNILQKVLACGFTIELNNEHVLKIGSEFSDARGITKESNVRTEIVGLPNIERYCKTNSLENLPFQFVQKSNVKVNDTPVYPVNVDDFNFRLTLNTEQVIRPGSGFYTNILEKWKDTKKYFRLMNRISLVHEIYPLRIDLTVLKESQKRGRNYVLEYTMEESGVIDAVSSYEVEIEVINEKVKDKISLEDLIKSFRKCIRYILSGYQETNYPISYKEISTIANEYLNLIYDQKSDKNRLFPQNFIGPSSYTLQIPNIIPINKDFLLPNIRDNYTVTEKADGSRKLLFINNKGVVVLINTNMEIQGTGVVCKNKKLFNTIIDGEHILHNKNGGFINLYAAFDIYFLNKENVKSLGFVPLKEDDNEKNFRLPLLHMAIKNLEIESVVPDKMPIRIEYKNFKIANISQSIFQCCNTILLSEKSGSFEYNTDGLIFTPANTGVGSSQIGKEGKMKKEAWDRSFKWKPAEFNTIDFLITTKKDKDGKDFIGNIFEQGTSNLSENQIKQYKTLTLRVGFDESNPKHGYMNPCGDVIEDNIKKNVDSNNEDGYKPVAFYPSNPSDPDASICNVLLTTDSEGNLQMMSEEGEVFGDGTIVEFKYDITKPQYYKWSPLRVRYDKTASYREGNKEYGNAYHVANNNWYSIHNPIDSDMISTGNDIPDEIANDDIYYNRVGAQDQQTKALRNFHNLFVKLKLISAVSKPGNTLVDLAVGQGGDMSKWIKSRLSFVFGIDISSDNIENRINGACARYLNYSKDFQIIPNALFIQGNSSINLKSGDGLYTEKGRQIMNAVFGLGTKDKDKLGAGVYKNYGKAREGFNITSCQFAIHYFFESIETLASFCRNVSEMTKVDGYFIGTSYDGKKIFNELKRVDKGESKTIFLNEKKIWQITKNYDRKSFPDDQTSLGYAINVYQESINKSFVEYLVNYNYFTRVLENFGFVPLTRDEAKQIDLTDGIISFEKLYEMMNVEIKKNKNKKNEYGIADKMSASEKKISFFNNCFIYKKIRNVNSESVYKSLIENAGVEESIVGSEENAAKEIVERTVSDIEQPVAKKLKKKVKLVIS